MTPRKLIQYYANLLILQYLQQPNAYATIQALVTPAVIPQTSLKTIAFSGTAASGSFVLNYGGQATSAIAWNASAATIQSDLQALTGLGSVTVAGSIAAGLTITFTGVPPIAGLLTITSNSLLTSGAVAIVLTVSETDVTLPLAVQAAFNLTGSNIAVGTQLDILGKYAGVSRSGSGFYGSILLNDADFLTLIWMATSLNHLGSSLADIQNLIATYFAGDILVFDYGGMRIGYYLSPSVGSINLAQMFVVSNLLPKPMGGSSGWWTRAGLCPRTRI